MLPGLEAQAHALGGGAGEEVGRLAGLPLVQPGGVQQVEIGQQQAHKAQARMVQLALALAQLGALQ